MSRIGTGRTSLWSLGRQPRSSDTRVSLDGRPFSDRVSRTAAGRDCDPGLPQARRDWTTGSLSLGGGGERSEKNHEYDGGPVTRHNLVSGDRGPRTNSKCYSFSKFYFTENNTG